MNWPWSRKPAPPAVVVETEEAEHPLAGGRRLSNQRGAALVATLRERTRKAAPRATLVGQGADASDNGYLDPWNQTGLGDAPDALFSWFGQQGFLGPQLAAIIAQHWFVDKACTIPARDAVRQGFTMSVAGQTKGDTVDKVALANKRLRLIPNLIEFERMKRVFGIRVAIYQVENNDPEYYELPFNPDGVRPGSYRGIVQVDPYWCTPLLDMSAASSPDAPDFYEPTYWVINGKRYHRSHLCIATNGEVPDLLKPAYMYGGLSVPQLIMERVYAAERTANEAPQLALSKRLNVYKTDLARLIATPDGGHAVFEKLAFIRDNFGTRVIGNDEEMSQLETSLQDLDELITGQYSIACAAARVPVTKMLGTAPKGMNATGEYDESSYHEELESIQSADLDPFLEGHFLRLSRSEFGGVEITVQWAPLDSPTAKEYAEIDKLRAETDVALVNAGAIDGEDVRNRIRTDKDGPYADISAEVPEPEEVTEPEDGQPDASGTDAEPRPLYVSRKLLNAADLIAWARKAGFDTVTAPGDMHVTVTYSRAAVDWMTMGENWSPNDGKLTIAPGGPRVVERLGDKGAAVLMFASSELSYRHKSMVELGASWDYESYQPHVTITYAVPEGMDVSKVEPYRGKLVFGPEIFEDLTDGWRPRET